MAQWKGTTVPNTGYVEKIYFNINLSVEEVVAELKKLTYADATNILFYIEGVTSIVALYDSIKDSYYIGDIQQNIPLFASEPEQYGFVGWNQDVIASLGGNSFTLNMEVTYLEGVGFENDKISSLFSITQFEEVEPITDLPKFLEANADAIRYAKGTSEKINAQNFAYEIKKLKKISVEPLSITQNGTYTAPEGSAYSPVEVNVPSENTLKKLLDATKSCYYLFSGYSGINVESFISYDDTSNVTNMDKMFNGCPNITTIPQLNTSNVRNMDSMFSNCHNITTIPQLDTSKVTSMLWIFNACSKLKSILMYGMKVSFDISSSTQFEREDLVTILNNLATVTTSKTLTMGATNLAKLTDEDKEIAIAKGWTLA